MGLKCALCIPFVLSGSSNECCQRMLATYMRRMRNNNLEIRIADSSCRQQKVMISFFGTIYTAKARLCLCRTNDCIKQRNQIDILRTNALF